MIALQKVAVLEQIFKSLWHLVEYLANGRTSLWCEEPLLKPFVTAVVRERALPCEDLLKREVVWGDCFCPPSTSESLRNETSR